MSKSIQIVSSHIGIISVSVKGESRTINFESKTRDGKTVGVGMVDHDEASVLLRVPKDFWKPGQGADDIKQFVDDSLTAAAAAGKAEREAEKSDSEGTKSGAEGDKKENEGGDQGSDDEDGQSAATKIAADNNFNRFKGAVTKCEDIELIKEIIAIEIAKEDPKENRLTVLNGRMTELQG
jgi:hypothetical protein